jgi:hypothetical protein
VDRAAQQGRVHDMTVGQLAAELADCDQEAEVLIQAIDDGETVQTGEITGISEHDEGAVVLESEV